MEWGRCGCAMSECMLAEAERKGDQIEKEKHTLLGSFEYRVYWAGSLGIVGLALPSTLMTSCGL